jgi:chaperone required for assembly of F1-ATPase
MRDIFEDISSQQPLDPSEATRRNMRATVRKRFFTAVSVEQRDGGFAVLLDGKPVKTPARRTLAAPTLPLAQKISAEWDAQRDVVEPASMPITRLANAIIDAVAERPGPVAQEVASYLGTDMVFYRADAPDGLIARQAEMWDPIVDFARDQFGARFVLAQGVVHVTQPREALDAAAKAILFAPGSPADTWRLGALSSATTLTGSALIALALAHGRLTLAQAWAAAHVDEDWNIAAWGSDEAALARRAARFADMQAAADVLALA